MNINVYHKLIFYVVWEYKFKELKTYIKSRLKYTHTSK